jgi:hypothetical protein
MDGLIIVTLWEGSARNLEGKLEVRVLDLSSGMERYRLVPPARLVRADKGHYYAYLQYPFPRIMRYDSPVPWSFGAR